MLSASKSKKKKFHLEVAAMKKDMKERSIHTGSASNVHGFEVAGFDDAHSDGVGCWVVAQGHQQIPSTSLKIPRMTAVAENCSLYHLFINIFVLSVSSSSALFVFHLPVSLPTFPPIPYHISMLPHPLWEHRSSQELHHPFNPISCSAFLHTYTAIATRFQLLPESLHVGQIQLVEWDRYFSYGIIPAEAVIVENLQVQSPLNHLFIGEP